MFCEGCEGDGAGDCTCAFAAGTATARIAAVKNCVQSRIVFSPILRASSRDAKEAPFKISNISEECSSRSERSDVVKRRIGTRLRTPIAWNLLLRAVRARLRA